MTPEQADRHAARPMLQAIVVGLVLIVALVLAQTLAGRSVVFGSANTTAASGPLSGRGARAALIDGFPTVSDETLAEVYAAIEKSARGGDAAAAGFIIDLARAQREKPAAGPGREP